ncbi:MAG: CDP-alcohol phosphatidyltransferase family protein, partial [Gemmatimonadales bacterium]
SRIGVVLDPIADKLFVATAFAVVWIAGQLTWYETLAVLARDIVASAAFFSALAAGRVAAVPARPGGKAVTMLQMATLVTFVLGWSGMRRLAWATAAVGLYAIYDYHQPFFRKLRAR